MTKRGRSAAGWTTGLPVLIEVWACPICGYWRPDKSTGVHVDFDTMPHATHTLVRVAYELVRQ